jgi:hypothetical protein
MPSNGDGKFQQAVSSPVGNQPISLVAADFNREGILDLAVGNEVDGTISVLLVTGDGTLVVGCFQNSPLPEPSKRKPYLRRLPIRIRCSLRTLTETDRQ